VNFGGRVATKAAMLATVDLVMLNDWRRFFPESAALSQPRTPLNQNRE